MTEVPIDLHVTKNITHVTDIEALNRKTWPFYEAFLDAYVRFLYGLSLETRFNTSAPSAFRKFCFDHNADSFRKNFGKRCGSFEIEQLPLVIIVPKLLLKF